METQLTTVRFQEPANFRKDQPSLLAPSRNTGFYA